MQLGLRGKVVLVTGGTKGIGRAIVKAFLAESSDVHFCARNKSDILTAVQDLAQRFPDSCVNGDVVDVSSPDVVRGWVRSVAEKRGGVVDVIVANVSSLGGGEGDVRWRQSFDIDMMHTVAMVDAAKPYLEKSRGSVVSIASVSGRDVDFTAPGPYGAMKAALVHYTAQLAHTMAPKGVRANAVSPGNIYIEDGVWGQIEREAPELFKRQMELNPMGRMGKAEEVANAVVFLASEKASFISGTNMVVDGSLCTGVQL
ncbi:MAG: hypothetical protein Q9160_003995 [Pyrenula sp. 1 TL-2023]